MSDFEEWNSGPPEDKSERLQGIRHLNEPTLCGYSNCFRPFYKMRGFMPCCKLHYSHPKKWGKDGITFTGSVFRKSVLDCSDSGSRCATTAGNKE